MMMGCDDDVVKADMQYIALEISLEIIG